MVGGAEWLTGGRQGRKPSDDPCPVVEPAWTYARGLGGEPLFRLSWTACTMELTF